MKIKTACLIILFSCSILSWADEKDSVSAKNLFYARVQPVKMAAPHKKSDPKKNNHDTPTRPIKYVFNTGLKYQLIRQLADGSESPVDPDTAFHSGDRIRLSFESNIKGYLYVVQQGSTGNWSVLFPDARINNGKNAISSGNRYVVPASGWFRFDETPGTEHLMVFLSQKPLDTSLPGATRAADPGGGTVKQSVVDELNNIKAQQTRSRALVFEKDSDPVNDASQPIPAAYIVNTMGQAVVAEINLRHN